MCRKHGNDVDALCERGSRSVGDAGGALYACQGDADTRGGYIAGEVDKIIFKPLGHAFERVTEEMHATWTAKNADYGSSFDGQGRELR